MVKSDLNMKGNGKIIPLAMAFTASMLGGIFGLGGGFIYNPVLISLGVAPSVAASTSMYMIMLTYTCSVSLLLVFNMINWPYSLWLCIWCGAGVFLGMSVISKVMKRFKR
jgi:uncharacterized membrane protein YfcA